MVETGFRMELTGHQPVLDAIGAALARMEHPRELYDAIGLSLLASVDQRFEGEEDPDGNPWPKSIRALADGGKTLTDSGHFRQTFTHEATDTGVAVGTNAIQGAILHFGGVIRAKNGGALHFKIGGQDVFVASVTIPARPIVGVSDEDEIEIIGLAGDWLTEPLGGADQNTREKADG